MPFGGRGSCTHTTPSVTGRRSGWLFEGRSVTSAERIGPLSSSGYALICDPVSRFRSCQSQALSVKHICPEEEPSVFAFKEFGDNDDMRQIQCNGVAVCHLQPARYVRGRNQYTQWPKRIVNGGGNHSALRVFVSHARMVLRLFLHISGA